MSRFANNGQGLARLEEDRLGGCHAGQMGADRLWHFVSAVRVVAHAFREGSFEAARGSLGAVRDILWAGMTIVSIGLLEAMGPMATPFASASGLRLGDAAEILLAVILAAVAVYSAVRLRRKDLTPR